MSLKKLAKEEIIKLIKNNPDQKWFVSKIANKIGVSVGSASNYINELIEEGKLKANNQEGSSAKYLEIKSEGNG